MHFFFFQKNPFPRNLSLHYLISKSQIAKTITLILRVESRQKFAHHFALGKNIFLKTGKGKEEEEEKGIKRYRSILDA